MKTAGLSTMEAVAVSLVAGWLNGFYDGGFLLTVKVPIEGNPWIGVTGEPEEPYERGSMPGKVRFAIWRETCAVHQVNDDGTVKDPAIYDVEALRRACYERIMLDEFDPPRIQKKPPSR